MHSKLNQLPLNPDYPPFLLWHGQIDTGLYRILVEYFKNGYHFLITEDCLMLTNEGNGLTSKLGMRLWPLGVASCKETIYAFKIVPNIVKSNGSRGGPTASLPEGDR